MLLESRRQAGQHVAIQQIVHPVVNQAIRLAQVGCMLDDVPERDWAALNAVVGVSFDVRPCLCVSPDDTKNVQDLPLDD